MSQSGRPNASRYRTPRLHADHAAQVQVVLGLDLDKRCVLLYDSLPPPCPQPDDLARIRAARYWLAHAWQLQHVQEQPDNELAMDDPVPERFEVRSLCMK